LYEITLRREELERDAQQSNLEREIKCPARRSRTSKSKSPEAKTNCEPAEEQIKFSRTAVPSARWSLSSAFSAARKSSAEELADFAAKARELVEAATRQRQAGRLLQAD
jgi:hypothetical protein